MDAQPNDMDDMDEQRHQKWDQFGGRGHGVTVYSSGNRISYSVLDGDSVTINEEHRHFLR